MMKLLAYLGIVGLMLIQTSCVSTMTDAENRYSGVIEPAGFTTYQYGTHKLITKDSFYALRSEEIDLNKYESMEVTLTASKIEGYPVDGGPVYLNVESIEK